MHTNRILFEKVVKKKIKCLGYILYITDQLPLALTTDKSKHRLSSLALDINESQLIGFLLGDHTFFPIFG